MMAENEDRTLALLESARKLIDRLIQESGGRIANTAGDSVIAVFEGATAALVCAVTIQTKLDQANKKFPASKKLLFRIGLHMGETYSRGNDILGGGVNIAARLEGSTEPGAICMSEAFYSVADRSEVNLPVADVGRLSLKNISEPIQAYEMLSSRSKSTGVEFRNKKQLSKQQRQMVILGSAGFVVFFAVMFAISVVYNFTRVAEMADGNKPVGLRGQVSAPASETIDSGATPVFSPQK